jgi:hypothetical protein
MHALSIPFKEVEIHPDDLTEELPKFLFICFPLTLLPCGVNSVKTLSFSLTHRINVAYGKIRQSCRP